MKRSLVLLPTALLIIFVLLSVLDRSEYVLEKKVRSIQKQYAQLALNPRSISENQFDSLIKQCDDLILKYPSSRLLSAVYMKLAEIYTLQGDLRSARSYYSKVLGQFSTQNEASATALMKIGSTYEKENNVKQAIDSYELIIKDYPDTKVCLNIPIYIVNYYLRIKHYEEAISALKQAEKYYKERMLYNKNSAVDLYVRGLLARTYFAEEQWNDALGVLKSILLDYGQSPYLDWRIADLVIQTINQISVEKLNDPDQAIIIYSDFLNKYPDHPLKAILQETMGHLNGLKSAKIK